VSKNKSKRNRTQRNSAPSSTLPGVAGVPVEHEVDDRDSSPGNRDSSPGNRDSSPGGRESSLSIDPTPSTDNVIPFPRASHVPSEPRDTKATLIAGTGSFGVAKAPASDEAPKAKDDSALRPAAGEHERTTIPPDEATGERKVTPVETVAKEPEKPSPKVSEDEARKTLRGEVVGKKESGSRGHKESLSTHLSDEAKAFFSDVAATAAYKQTHDTFEDLAPAAEDHAAEVARSKRWMTITGVLLVGVIGVVVAFAVQARYSVPETRLAVAPAPVVEPTAPPAATPPPAPTPEPAPVPVPTTTPGAEVDRAVAPAAEPVVAAATPDVAVAAPPAATPPPADPVATPTPAPVVVPGGQTPQQLLAAARATRGPFAAKVAAYTAYFDAAPTDDRTMTTYAMSLAEGSHHAEAETIANRAVTANPRSGQAWFVLAYSRSQLRNREGAAEARTRCIALGGTWATECRAIR